MFSEFSYELKMVLKGSRIEMTNLKHSYIGTEHILLAILKFNNTVSKKLMKYGISYDSFKGKVIDLLGFGKEESKLFIYTPLLKKIIDNAIIYSNEYKLDEIDLDTFFSLMIDMGEGVAIRLLQNYDIDISEFYEIITDNTNSFSKNVLNDYGTDLTLKASLGELDPVIGREKEVDNIIEIVLKKSKCNPLLIGDAGVGKTAIVEEFARRINDMQVPIKLYNYKVYSVSMASLVSGTKYRGEFEEKILNVIKYAENNKVILFIDEIHTLVGAGGAEGAIDASNILKPALSRGNITIIGATTKEEYKKYIEKDKALVRRFDNIYVSEPDYKSLLKILFEVKENYEKYHNVIIDDESLKYLVKVASKYFYYKKEPDRSIDLLDVVCSYSSSKLSNIQNKNIILKKSLYDFVDKKKEALKNNNYSLAIKYREKEREIQSLVNANDIKMVLNKRKKKITKKLINEVLSKKINVNVHFSKVEKNVIRLQKKEFDEFTISQKNVIDEFLPFFNLITSGDVEINKPISLLFRGKTGMGKSFCAETIGKKLFNGNYLIIDAVEYSNEKKIYEFQECNEKCIFDKLHNKPLSLIVFDNFEFCSNKLKKLINNIIKLGYYDSNKEKYIFKNSLFIFIYNEHETKYIGFNSKKETLDVTFEKEIIFNDLNIIEVKKIIENILKRKEIKYNEKTIKNLINKMDYKKSLLKNLENIINEYVFKEKLII